MQKDIKDFFKKHGYTVDKSENIWKRQEKIKEAENKFGLIILDYSLRERLKIFSRLTGIEDFKILSYWSRSIISSDFSLEHPDYLEYKKHYGVGDVDWLEKGKTYVDMKKYKKEK